MISGKLRDLVLIQALVETPDEIGQPVQSWEDVGTYYANVRDLQGREALVARQIQANLTHAVEVRNLGPDLDPLSPQVHRFIHEGRTLGIESVIDTFGDHRSYVCYCRSIVH